VSVCSGNIRKRYDRRTYFRTWGLCMAGRSAIEWTEVLCTNSAPVKQSLSAWGADWVQRITLQ
jgi:hypothetical protein